MSSSPNESALKRAIKENENSIIQSILSPTILTSNTSDKNAKGAGGNTDEKLQEGLSPLLDYLFEDGQLTRIEYDLIDKGLRGKATTEKVKMLLRILIENQDEEASKVLLEHLHKSDPQSDTVRKLSLKFLSQKVGKHGSPDCQGLSSHTVIGVKGFREVIESTKALPQKSSTTNDSKDKITVSEFNQNVSLPGESSQHQDFYYGRSQKHNSSQLQIGPVENGNCEGTTKRGWIPRGNVMQNRTMQSNDTVQQQQMNKANKDPINFRDFYMTNGCLETTCNLILYRNHKKTCRESLTPSSWERVLRSMNGLLSTDVLSIKELLCLHQRSSEKDHSENKVQRKEAGKVGRINIALEKETNLSEEGKEKTVAVDYHTSFSSAPQDMRIEFPEKEMLNWDQIIYHSFQVWKVRNGRNATFYSLVGVFQHAMLLNTADFLLENKMEIQSKEHEKETVESASCTTVVDENGTRRTSRVTMLEKSDFLRKFYIPSRSSFSNDIGNGEGTLSTINDRVCVSPVLSLDLLL